jgi:hypothetical protein
LTIRHDFASVPLSATTIIASVLLVSSAAV